MHDSVKELGAKRKNRLHGNVWILECKERVYRRDEYSHVIICYCKRESCGAKLSRMSDASTYVLHATVNRIYDSHERRKCIQILHRHNIPHPAENNLQCIV